MVNIRVMPCLLLSGDRLVKTVNFKNPNYIGDPVNAVRIYNDKEVDELVFLDINATSSNKINYSKIKEIASECFMPLTYGGGIKSIAEMKKIYSLGVEKIVICTHATLNPDFITEAAKIFGSQSVVVAIDVKKNFWGKEKVYSHSGTIETKFEPIAFAKVMEKKGAGEIFLNSIDQEGTFCGFNEKLIKKMSKAINIPLIACGGASCIADFLEAVKSGASAVAAGSLFVYFRNHVDGVLINFPSYLELKKVREYGS